jgi:hypothetical protein
LAQRLGGQPVFSATGGSGGKEIVDLFERYEFPLLDRSMFVDATHQRGLTDSQCFASTPQSGDLSRAK